jgi:RNA polymerase sigma-70 factor (ECF subfamily)
MTETLLHRAAQGDEHAFRELTDPYRRELQLHCYRMLGSMQDAEDALQETMIGAWRGLSGFEGRASVRGWLYRIATNCCLNARRSRREPATPEAPFEVPPPTRMSELTWLEPYPDHELPDPAPGPEARYATREAVELAFIVALQHLPPRQRAALVLRDVLGFRAREVAEMLQSSEEAVKGALKRARVALDERPRPAAPDAAQERELLARFSAALAADDVEALVALLTEDALLTMPPSPLEYVGREAIRSFLVPLYGWRSGQPVTLVASRANNQHAFAAYRTDPQSGVAHAIGLYVPTLAGDRVSVITVFLGSDPLARLGLPRTLADRD